MRKQKKPAFILCPHCRAENPPRAYCCITCFKVMYGKPKLSFWETRIPSSAFFLAVLFAITGSGYVVMQRWLKAMETQITIHMETEQYHLSFIANKKEQKIVD